MRALRGNSVCRLNFAHVNIERAQKKFSFTRVRYCEREVKRSLAGEISIVINFSLIRGEEMRVQRQLCTS